MGSRQERVSKLSALFRSLRTLDFFWVTSSNSRNRRQQSKLEMARLLAILCLASVALAQDRYWGSYSASYPAGGGGNSGSVAESRATLERAQFGNFNPQPRTPAPRRAPVVAPRRAPPAPRAPVVPRVVEKSIYSTEDVEPGQYVHNPEWDLTPYQLWKRKQAAKKGLQANANSLPEPARKVVTVRKQKPKSRPAAAAPQKQQSRFQNFQQVEQQRSSPAYQQQQQPRREQAYYQPAPQQPVQPAYQQPAFNQQTFQQPQQPQRAAAYQQPAYQQQTFQQPQQIAAYPRAQHQTYTQEYIFEANNNAQRIYSYTAPKYQAKAEGESYSYAAIY